MIFDASPPELAALLPQASVEVSSRGHQLDELRDNFRPGIDVTITFLPGDNYRHNVDTAVALRRAGYNPVPHIAARELASREALDDFLARAHAEADVTRVVLIAARGSLVQQLGAGERPARVGDEEGEQVKLTHRQVQLPAVAAGAHEGEDPRAEAAPEIVG